MRFIIIYCVSHIDNFNNIRFYIHVWVYKIVEINVAIKLYRHDCKQLLNYCIIELEIRCTLTVLCILMRGIWFAKNIFFNKICFLKIYVLTYTVCIMNNVGKTSRISTEFSPSLNEHWYLYIYKGKSRFIYVYLSIAASSIIVM